MVRAAPRLCRAGSGPRFFPGPSLLPLRRRSGVGVGSPAPGVVGGGSRMSPGGPRSGGGCCPFFVRSRPAGSRFRAPGWSLTLRRGGWARTGAVPVRPRGVCLSAGVRAVAPAGPAPAGHRARRPVPCPRVSEVAGPWMRSPSLGTAPAGPRRQGSRSRRAHSASRLARPWQRGPSGRGWSGFLTDRGQRGRSSSGSIRFSSGEEFFGAPTQSAKALTHSPPPRPSRTQGVTQGNCPA